MAADSALNFIWDIRNEKMQNDLDRQIRLAAKQIIIADYPAARVYPFNALSHDIKEWAGMFRCADDKTFGAVIKRAALKGEWKNGKRDRRQIPYDIWIFYGFRSGEGVTENDNSDNEFGEILDTIYEGFKSEPRLGFDTEIETHDLLQYLAITTLKSGEETLHFAQGRLNVRLCC